MKVREGFDNHCFHIRGYALLSHGVRLERVVDAALAARVLTSLRDRAGQPSPKETLRAGQDSLTALGDSLKRNGLAAHVRELVSKAEQEAGDGSGAAQLLKALKRRAVEWRAGHSTAQRAVETAIEIARGVEATDEAGGNPYVAAVAHRTAMERADEIAREASARLPEVDACVCSLEEELRREIERLRKQDERLAQLSQGVGQGQVPVLPVVQHSFLKRWRPSLALGTVVFALALVLGISILAAAGASVALAALSAVVQWRAANVPTPPATDATIAVETMRTVPRRRMTESLREKFISYGRALEDAAVLAAEGEYASRLLLEMETSTWNARSTVLQQALDETEAILREELDSIPEGFFHEADPGHVELFGSELVDVLVNEALSSTGAGGFLGRVLSVFAQKEGATFAAQLQAGDGRAAAQGLLTAIAEIRPRLRLGETIARLERSDTGQRLFMHWLDALAGVACSALALGQEMRLDPALSIVRLTIGLPAGESDPLASVFRQRLPHAGVTLGSFPDAIEFVFDVRNLPSDALMTHELSRPHYQAANLWEREKLWHYPKAKIGQSRLDEDASGFGHEVFHTLRPKITVPLNGDRAEKGKRPELIFPGDMH